jgi:hypothetical protein
MFRRSSRVLAKAGMSARGRKNGFHKRTPTGVRWNQDDDATVRGEKTLRSSLLAKFFSGEELCNVQYTIERHQSEMGAPKLNIHLEVTSLADLRDDAHPEALSA